MTRSPPPLRPASRGDARVRGWGDDYVSKVKESARQAQEAGFLLEPEARAMIAEAEAAAVPY